MVNTHYFSRPPKLDKTSFTIFVADVKKLLAAKPMELLVCGVEGVGEPQADDVRIAFNGDAEHGLHHEPLIIEQTYTLRPASRMRGGVFSDFCKTHGKPYDLLVVAVLYGLIYHFPFCKFTSDSDEKELRPGFEFFAKVCAPSGDADRLFRRPLVERE